MTCVPIGMATSIPIRCEIQFEVRQKLRDYVCATHSAYFINSLYTKYMCIYVSVCLCLYVVRTHNKLRNTFKYLSICIFVSPGLAECIFDCPSNLVSLSSRLFACFFFPLLFFFLFDLRSPSTQCYLKRPAGSSVRFFIYEHAQEMPKIFLNSTD